MRCLKDAWNGQARALGASFYDFRATINGRLQERRLSTSSEQISIHSRLITQPCAPARPEPFSLPPVFFFSTRCLLLLPISREYRICFRVAEPSISAGCFIGLRQEPPHSMSASIMLHSSLCQGPVDIADGQVLVRQSSYPPCLSPACADAMTVIYFSSTYIFCPSHAAKTPSVSLERGRSRKWVLV